MTKKDKRQIYHSTANRKKSIMAAVITAFIFIGFLMVLLISRYNKYSPPELDDKRQTGIPAPDEKYLYETIDTDYGYSFRIAANLFRQKDGSVMIYFTNPAENSVSLMCAVNDTDDGTVYYKSGRINPGEYIEKLDPNIEFENEVKNITVRIYAFEPTNYTSAGSTNLKMVLQPW